MISLLPKHYEYADHSYYKDISYGIEVPSTKLLLQCKRTGHLKRESFYAEIWNEGQLKNYVRGQNNSIKSFYYSVYTAILVLLGIVFAFCVS